MVYAGTEHVSRVTISAIHWRSLSSVTPAAVSALIASTHSARAYW